MSEVIHISGIQIGKRCDIPIQQDNQVTAGMKQAAVTPTTTGEVEHRTTRADPSTKALDPGRARAQDSIS